MKRGQLSLAPMFGASKTDVKSISRVTRNIDLKPDETLRNVCCILQVVILPLRVPSLARH